MFKAARSKAIVWAIWKRCSVSSVFIISSGLTSLSGVPIRPRNTGSTPPSSTILYGEKKALCSGRLPCSIGWKVEFNLFIKGWIILWPKRKAAVAKAFKMDASILGSYPSYLPSNSIPHGPKTFGSQKSKVICCIAAPIILRVSW